MARDDRRPDPGPGTLNGWKEIAAYLGKSVRSAQRWEQELGLPTHRIKTPDGQIVYALKSEIDSWRRSLDPRAKKLEERAADRDPQSAVPVAAQGADSAGAGRPRAPVQSGWFLAGGAILLAVVVVGSLWVYRTVPNPQAPTSVNLALVGRELRASREDGTRLWVYTFDRDVVAAGSSTPFAPISETTVAVARLDLDHDGLDDNLLALHAGVLGKREAEVLAAVTDSGRLIWQIHGDQTLNCGGKSYSGPWRVSAFAASASSQRVWVSYTHHTWWPSYVVEVMPDGRQELRYVQSGWVMSLIEWPTPDGVRLVAGGVLNEHQQASLVVLDPSAPLTSSGSADPAFVCQVDGGTAPSRILVFPDFEVPQALGNPYLSANRIARVGDGLKVDLNEYVVAHVAPDGSPTEIGLTDGYRFKHRELEQGRLLSHPERECPERAATKTVRRWSPDRGWEALEMPLAVR